MTICACYAAMAPKSLLKPFKIERREPGAHDVVIEILYCGICHSDVHQARDEWGHGIFPMVPGHEIVGRVSKVGADVLRFKVGEMVGVGCFVDSCRECQPCKQNLQQYCEKGMNQTYNGRDKAGDPTYGGYSTRIVVDENYILKIPSHLKPAAVAPLLCAGITTWSPLKHWNVKANDKVAVLGLGGLGHMAVKLAAALGAEVTVFSTSISKEQDAKRLGATHFALSKDDAVFKKYANYFDLIINTISADINLGAYLGLLKLDATMVCVGAPEKPTLINSFPLIFKRRSLAGSLIGGIKETQEMLDFCGQHNIVADIELISADKINEAYERMLKSDVKYRFVIDTTSISNS